MTLNSQHKQLLHIMINVHFLQKYFVAAFLKSILLLYAGFIERTY